MKIAFIHYHLKTGGVTSVLRQQVESLPKDFDILVISGSPPQADFPADVFVIPELGYTPADQEPFDSQAVAERINQAVHQKFGAGCDILHVHNPTLAKNKQFLEILSALQKRNLRLFLQIHDFAEDGRPFSYSGKNYLSDCHYGVINSRDYRILLKAGLKTRGLHLLPNMINPIYAQPQSGGVAEFILYPIRAIRRKNIGEAILLSLFFPRRETLVITLPPNSPVDLHSYRDWKSLVSDHQLNVAFDAGMKKDFTMLVQSAKSLVTTSITEGFGFSYLEPWVYDKFLWGRKLIHLSDDFKKHGVDLDHLYSQFLVPLKWFNQKFLKERWINCVQTVGRLFEFPISDEHIERSFEFITRGGNIDFGLLDECFQKQTILQVKSKSKNVETLKRLNPFLTNPGEIGNAEHLIAANKNSVLENFNENSYRQRLIDIYHSVKRHRVIQHIDKNILLSEFVNLNEFSLLKWCDYIG